LILLTYVLAVFGTFLTRSGILSSIHTFTEGPIGKWFLPFLGLMLIGGIAVIAARYESLRSANRFDSLLSRESAFLANNVLFAAAALTVLWGTIYPVIAEVVTGTRLSVGPPFFNSVFVPIGLALILLTGIGPLLSWRRTSNKAFLRIVRVPLAAGAVTVVVLALTGVRSVGALLAFGLCAFTAVAIISEFVRGSRTYRSRGDNWFAALGQTLTRNRRRYGGYVVHLGVVLIVIGFSGAAFKTERHAVLATGESMDIGSYTLRYDGLSEASTDEKEIFRTEIDVSRDGSHVTTMRPERNFHIAQQQPQSEVAIRTSPVEDLYLVVTSIDPDGDIALRSFVNPLTWWIWAGAGVMLLGISIVLAGNTPVAVAASAKKKVREPAVVGAG
jgi:cytochrome c-type biogenesis protein CcmF